MSTPTFSSSPPPRPPSGSRPPAGTSPSPAAPNAPATAPPPASGPNAPASAAGPQPAVSSPWGDTPGTPGNGQPGAPEKGKETAGAAAGDALKGAAADQVTSRVPYADKAAQAKRVADAGREGGAKAAGEEAAALGGATAARAAASTLTAGASDAAGAVAPQINKAIDKIGEMVGRGTFKVGAKAVAAGASVLLIAVIAIIAGVTAVVAGIEESRGAPGPSQEQCDSMPANWCDVLYDAQLEVPGKSVPWTVLAGLVRVTTDYGRTSPYDVVDREPARPTPPFLAQFAVSDTTAVSASSGSVAYNSGSLAWGGHSNGQIPKSAICALPWDPTVTLKCDARDALVALNEKYKAEHGANLPISQGYRDMAGQQYWRAYWCARNKCANAAQPGTSNHGWALAIDFDSNTSFHEYDGDGYKWMKANGPAFGWVHPPFMEPGARGPHEAWHFEFQGVATGSAAPAAYHPTTSVGLAAGVSASDSASTCAVATPQVAIGGQGRQAEGPFLLLPAAAAQLREDGGDPQNPCDAAGFVARALGEAVSDVKAEMGTPSREDQSEQTAFWQAVITAARVVASPDETSGECLVDTTEEPVDVLIERIWGCEISQTGALHVVENATKDAQGNPVFNEYAGSAAGAVLISEAKAVAWSASQYGAATCSESSPTAGVFPLTAEQASANGAVARCDVQANIRAAARIVLAGEAVPVSDRSTAGGPYEPMLGGWAAIAPALGSDLAAFRTSGPRAQWSSTGVCDAAITSYVLPAAGAGSPFTSLANITAAPSDTAPYTAALGPWPQSVRATCGAASDAELAAQAATITLAAASDIPGFGIPRTDGTPTATVEPSEVQPDEDPLSTTAGAGSSTTAPPLLGTGIVLTPQATGDRTVEAATAPQPEEAPADAQALLGLTNWFTWQADLGDPGEATYGADSVVSRLSTSGKHPQPLPAPSVTDATIVADPWQQRATEWAIFYGGLVSPFDTHGERTGSLASSLTGASGQYAAVAGDTSTQVNAVINAAKKYLGTPYSWGGGGPNGPAMGLEGVFGFDCSGLTEYAFAQAGYKIGTTTAQQKDVGTSVASLSEAQPGDLLFFGSPKITHVAIYLGDNQVIEAPKRGDVVKIQGVGKRTPVLIKRVIEARATTGGDLNSWVGQALAVLYANGFPKGADDVAALNLIIQHESSGNPAAVNRTDSNARAGHPSFGLMQTIPSTFEAYALPGHTDKSDPVAQIIAGSRYAQKVYGGLDNVPGVKAVRAGGDYVGY